MNIVNVLKEIYADRPDWSHKGDFGRLLIIGGSFHFTGSPILNAISALRSGVDLVTIAAPSRAADVAAHFLPDLITIPLDGTRLNRGHINMLLKLEAQYHAVLIGSGLGEDSETYFAVQEYLQNTQLPFVIDGNGIRALAQKPDIIKGKQGILTPHANEFINLIDNKSPSLDITSRKDKATELAIYLNGPTILLKGHIDVIASPSQLHLNETGNPQMTKGGTGDTLAGICGSLLARKVDPFKAAAAAAYLNGKAGDLVAHQKGEGLLASDLFDAIPQVIQSVLQ